MSLVILYTGLIAALVLAWPWPIAWLIAGAAIEQVLAHPVWLVLATLLTARLAGIAAAALLIAGGLYLQSYRSDEGWRWPWLRQRLDPLWFVRRFYGYRLRGKLHAGQAVLYAIHPHGCFAAAAGLAFLANPAYEGVVAVETVMLRVPVFLRELFLWFGAVDKRRPTIGAHLAAGRSVVLVPGGAGDDENPRRFLHVAHAEWKHGIVVVWSPGERSLAWSWRIPALAGVKLFGVPLDFIFLPKPPWLARPLHVIVSDRILWPVEYKTADDLVAAYDAELERLKT